MKVEGDLGEGVSGDYGEKGKKRDMRVVLGF